MEKYTNLSNVIGYVKKNWFQVALITILTLIILQKDFSFQINMNDPEDQEVQEEYLPQQELGKLSPEKKPSFTENKVPTAVAKGSTSLFDRLDLNLFSSSTAKSLPTIKLKDISEEDKFIYLKRFSHVAISERKKYGIPSSIILANGLLQSTAGKDGACTTANNHFRIPCTIDWQGESVVHQNECYRYYESAWASYRDHSRFLSSGKFASLLVLGPNNYKGWARGMEDLNFGKQRNLANQLIEIIETYELYRFDEK